MEQQDPLYDPLSECWNCGKQAKEDDKGRVLCAPCRVRIAVSDMNFQGTRFSQDYYNDHCIRCSEATVAAFDDLGICPKCVQELRSE